MPFAHKCERKLNSQHNHCSACGEYFNSTSAFEMHRIGEFGVNRRCATVAEMEGKGMSLNSGGWWIERKMGQEGIAKRRPAKTERLSQQVNT